MKELAIPPIAKSDDRYNWTGPLETGGMGVMAKFLRGGGYEIRWIFGLNSTFTHSELIKKIIDLKIQISERKMWYC